MCPSRQRLHRFRSLMCPSRQRLHPFRSLMCPSRQRLYPFRSFRCPSRQGLDGFRSFQCPSRQGAVPLPLVPVPIAQKACPLPLVPVHIAPTATPPPLRRAKLLIQYRALAPLDLQPQTSATHRSRTRDSTSRAPERPVYLPYPVNIRGPLRCSEATSITEDVKVFSRKTMKTNRKPTRTRASPTTMTGTGVCDQPNRWSSARTTTVERRETGDALDDLLAPLLLRNGPGLGSTCKECGVRAREVERAHCTHAAWL